MSTDLMSLGNQLPAEMLAALQARAAADKARLGATGGKDTIRVTQNKKFVLPDDSEVDSFNAIVVGFVYRNEYYVGAYNPKAITPPACFAISDSATNLIASDNSPIKQSDDGCGPCQQNQWGSSPTGNGKACKNTVLLALLPPDADEDSTIMILKSSPTAIKAFNNHVSEVLRKTNCPVDAVVTNVHFDPSSTYATLRFGIEGVNPIFEITDARRDEAHDRLMQEPDVSSFEQPTAKK